MKYQKLKNYDYRIMEEDERIHTKLIGYEFEDKFMKVEMDGWITGKIGYAWDGVSVGFQTKTNRISSLFHDIGAQLTRMGVVPKDKQDIFHDLFDEINRKAGMSRFRVWYCGKGVRTKTARKSFIRGKQKREKIYEVPSIVLD